ncbi:MAG TPA: hypothetical protein VGD98_14480 [Ktedonobacteraceae bacterium]
MRGKEIERVGEIFPGALQTSLTMEGLLFAAFGFLYSAYCHYSTLATPENPLRAPIVHKLARACLFICIAVTLDGLLAVVIIIGTIFPGSVVGMLLGLGFVATIILVAVINWYLALSM